MSDSLVPKPSKEPAQTIVDYRPTSWFDKLFWFVMYGFLVVLIVAFVVGLAASPTTPAPRPTVIEVQVPPCPTPEIGE